MALHSNAIIGGFIIDWSGTSRIFWCIQNFLASGVSDLSGIQNCLVHPESSGIWLVWCIQNRLASGLKNVQNRRLMCYEYNLSTYMVLCDCGAL